MKSYKGIDVGSIVWIDDDGKRHTGIVLSIEGTGSEEWNHERGEFLSDVSVCVRYFDHAFHCRTGYFRPRPDNHNNRETWVYR